MDLNLLSITFNIHAPTNDILFITTSCNYSYQHVNLFNEFVDKFDKLDKDYWTCMFNVECIIKPSILKVVLPIDAINKSLVFVKSKDMFLLYNCNNFLITYFNVKVLLVSTSHVKNKQINISKYNCFLCIMSSNYLFFI
jgi:hypothetical protein